MGIKSNLQNGMEENTFNAHWIISNLTNKFLRVTKNKNDIINI